MRELDKLVDIYELSNNLTNLPEPGASITWVREIKNINKTLLTPTVLDKIVQKVNEVESPLIRGGLNRRNGGEFRVARHRAFPADVAD